MQAVGINLLSLEFCRFRYGKVHLFARDGVWESQPDRPVGNKHKAAFDQLQAGTDTRTSQQEQPMPRNKKVFFYVKIAVLLNRTEAIKRVLSRKQTTSYQSSSIGDRNQGRDRYFGQTQQGLNALRCSRSPLARRWPADLSYNDSHARNRVTGYYNTYSICAP